MNFKDYIIDEDDYKFFGTLPKDEKLLFIYDLICDDYYGAGSVDVPEMSFTPITLEELDSRFQTIVSGNINENVDVNILILNNKLIVNSNSEDLLNKTIKDMILDGMILSKYIMTERMTFIFQQQRFCKIYTILGKEDKICNN